MDEKKKLVSLIISQLNICCASMVNLCSMRSFLAYSQQWRRNMLLLVHVMTRQNKLHKKLKMKKIRSLMRKTRSTWVVDGRSDIFWQNLLNGRSPEWCWMKNLRLTRERFFELNEMLCQYLAPDHTSPNYRHLSSEKKLALTLYYLKDTGSLWMTANAFGVHQCTVSKIIMQVCHVICERLGPVYLFLPRTREEMNRKVSEFELRYGMIQAFGCIDGTHIPIKTPQANSQDYFNYKQYFSINVQATCDYRGYFMDVDCRWPGSVHDAKVFANSKINHKLRNGQMPLTFSSPLPGYGKIPNYVIGDPAYPLTPFCIKEYQSCSTNQQVVFNTMLRAARNPIECAFGRLKARWAILTRRIDFKLESIPTIIYACFVLHNFCEVNQVKLDENLVRIQMRRNKVEEERLKNAPDHVYSCNNAEGEVVRTILTTYIRDNLPDGLV